MGRVIEGKWIEGEDMEKTFADGEFHRATSEIRNWITRDGSPGPRGRGGYRAEANRYHLYIMEGCPWAHRAWLMWTVKGLADLISLSFLVPRPGPQGWCFDPSSDTYRDPLHDRNNLLDVYVASEPDYNGRVTVPVLWDQRTETIVSNDSADIVEMLDGAFDHLLDDPTSYYPVELRTEIDELNVRVYEELNQGVYRTGFAQTSEVYRKNVVRVFDMLDELEERLADRRYLFGDRLTIADWRLFPTLIRFDAAYHSAFGCSLRRLIDYPNLWAYTRDLYQHPGVADTVRLDAYRIGYHSIPFAVGHRSIVPAAPLIDYTEPHGRDQVQAQPLSAAC
jgi:putative glutathione S-transferase